jgi:hypothetical protein
MSFRRSAITSSMTHEAFRLMRYKMLVRGVGCCGAARLTPRNNVPQ